MRRRVRERQPPPHALEDVSLGYGGDKPHDGPTGEGLSAASADQRQIRMVLTRVECWWARCRARFKDVEADPGHGA